MIFKKMGDHARGDCKNVICSSDEEELQQQGYRESSYFPTATVMISQLDFCDKRVPLPGTSGEAPPVPAPPTADDTDRQFWAEDEMSSSESRLRLVCKQRRRHSLAYRDRVAIRKRSRSRLCQSSSSNSDSAAQLKIQSPIRNNARGRRTCNHRQGPSATKRSKGGNNISVFRTCTPRPQLDSKTLNRSTAVSSSLQSEIQHPNPRRRMESPYTPSTRRRSGSRRSQPPHFPCSCNLSLPINNESVDIDKCRKDNPRPPLTSKRK